MSQLIAEMYEINKKIGAGGGGVVYLGRHIRLDKQIVLKADKRTLDTKETKLRREVNLLKDLSHTYIPKVYDFVQQDGVVYTVMDYIEGESLDKLLERNQVPSQKQVIQWACQLLEALIYLHKQPPYGILHGDIKPANIMLKPNGDICLIDFNIALALGEDGAVKVGYSRGYASPEHYGAEYLNVSYNRNNNVFESRQESTDKTEILNNEKTEILNIRSRSQSKSTTEKHKGLLLDVRSDIYSLGATLYHLISGCRPAQDAREVKPLGTDVCSEAVSAILQKAMASQPDQRYQSAEEMLNAFLQLHKNDKRAVLHRRHIVLTAAILSVMFGVGGICTFIGLSQMKQREEALALAEYSANALSEGDVATAVSKALQAIPTENDFFSAPVTAEAQKALTDALGVYDLSDGFQAFDSLELPGAPFSIAISPQGTRFAIIYAYEMAVFDFKDLNRLVTLPIQESALSDCVFVDEENLVYSGEQGITAYNLKKDEIGWIGEPGTTLAVSADRQRVAAIDRDKNKVIVYDALNGTHLTERAFGDLELPASSNDRFADPQNYVFSLNDSGNLLAVSFLNGALMISNLDDSDEDMIIYDASDYSFLNGGFCGNYFAFIAQNSVESQFAVIDVAEQKAVGGYSSQDWLILEANEQGIYLANGNLLVSVDLEKMTERELAYTGDTNICAFDVGKDYVLLATENHKFSFFDNASKLISSEDCVENLEFVRLMSDYAILGNRSETSLRLLKNDKKESSQLLKYDAGYDHDEARISQDGKTAMLFSYKGFRLYSMEGTLITEVKLPDAGHIYDQQFIRNNELSMLETIWYDGTRRYYSAVDGTLLREEIGQKPQKDLYEEFYTEQYKIASNLHSAPEVYDQRTGKLIATLESDDYLTYVTQVGEYIITEYINTAGERYGYLMDIKLQKLAYLPNLSDIIGNMLVFDNQSGNLRQSRLYSLQELIALGEVYITK